MSSNPRAFLQHENARLREENAELQTEVRNLRDFVSALESLISASDHFRSDAELLPFLRRTLSLALSLLNAPDGSLALLDNGSNELVFVIVHGALSEALEGYRMPADEGIIGWVIQQQQAALVRDVRHDPRFYRDIDEHFRFRTQSIAAAPLIGDRKVYGVVEVLNQPGDQPFTDADCDLLRLLCRAAGEALADIERTQPNGNTHDSYR